MNQQREVIYSLRSFALDGGEELKGESIKMVEQAVARRILETIGGEEDPMAWDVDVLRQDLMLRYLLTVPCFEEDGIRPKSTADAEAEGRAAGTKAFHAKIEALGDFADQVLALVMLNVLDEKWKDHLYDLDQLRNAGMAVTRWATLLVVAGLLAKLLLPYLARAVPTRRLLFLAASLAIGPGLLVNAFFKETWGRPRPSETTLFGGPWEFVRAWVPGGSCPTNCSFPSGEASGAAWLLALVFVVPERWRRPTLALVAL
mgnify:CR=1 FL=1